MPITANIIQTMKQTVNAVVLAVTTDQLLYVCDAIACPQCPISVRGSLGRRLRGSLIYVKLNMYRWDIFEHAAMRLTNFTDYSLRVLIYLGTRRADARLATIGDIAAAYGISGNHLRKVVHHLAQAGYIETTRGKGGGMRLARAPVQINIGELVRGTEEDFTLVECLEKGNRNCPIAPACALAPTLDRALRAFFRELDGQTLADLLRPEPKLTRVLRETSERR
jgi:Rrf2 family nitric oxide-sensitive transcriptional repressor